MFLVTLSCSHDDLPVRLFAMESDAREYIAAQPDPDGKPSADVDHLCDLLSIDHSESLGWSLITFDDGKPVAREMVRWFDEEVAPPHSA